MGDAILTLPLLQNLHLAYPEAELHFWVRKGVADLFRPNPMLTAVHEFDKRGQQKSGSLALALGKELRGQGYDLWISPHTSPRSALVAWSSGIETRVGYRSPWYNRLAYTHTVDRCFPELPEIERLNRLLLPLDIPAREDHPELVLPLSALEIWRKLGITPGLRSQLNFFQGVQAEQVADSPQKTALLGLHPGSTWGTKRWPVEYFARIAGQALQAGGRVALFAGPGEEVMANEVRERTLAAVDNSLHPGLIDLAGRLTLQELAACLGGLDAYLCNDSGPMHIAWALRTPTVAIFGPTVPAQGFAPRGPHSHVLETELNCRPCSKHGPQSCPLGHHDCMKLVSPEQVWQVLTPYLGLTHN